MPVSHVARYHCHFYLRPRVGGDLPISPIWALRCQFLLTPPRGGRRKESADLVEYIHISTHAPAWGATSSAWERRQRKEFLLTPPRGGRPGVRLHRGGATGISTHAPVWGAHTPARHAAGRNRRVTAVKGGSAPSHPRQNQSSPSGSASQTIGEKGSGLKPIRTPLGTLSSFTTAS